MGRPSGQITTATAAACSSNRPRSRTRASRTARLSVSRGTSDLGHGRGEQIAAATDGSDHARALPQLAAQARELDVDGAIEGGGVAAAGPVQELLARQDALGMGHEGGQE